MKALFDRSFMTQFSYRSRCGLLLKTLAGGRFEHALDYGCADGGTLQILYERGIIHAVIGLDDAPDQIAACRKNHALSPAIQYYLTNQIPRETMAHAYDLVICTEVLEHARDPQRLVEDLVFFCRPQARVIVSVPIEIGPSLLVKQAGRRLAYGNNPYGYEKYNWKEMFSAVVRWDVKRFETTHSLGMQWPLPHRKHKGFDFRDARNLLGKYFTVEKTLYSPLQLFGSFCNATVFWICRWEAHVA